MGHVSCVTCVVSLVTYHVSHVTWHATDVTQILAIAMFFKRGGIKDHNGKNVMCHMCHVTCVLSLGSCHM